MRVDSPGGSVLASERIRQALLEAKDAEASRSSCRWAMSPRRAAIGSRPRPTSSTPSRRPSPDRSACSASCRASRARCRSSASAPTAIKTTPLSGEPDLLKGPSPEANQLIQTGVESTYRRFLGDRRRSRATSRPRTSTRSPRAGCGTAAPRASSGLVDGFGGMSEAIAKAARAGQARRRARRALSRAAQELPRPAARDRSPADSDDSSSAPTTRSRSLAARPRAAARGGDRRGPLDPAGPSIQARCLECPPVAPGAGS